MYTNFVLSPNHLWLVVIKDLGFNKEIRRMSSIFEGHLPKIYCTNFLGNQILQSSRLSHEIGEVKASSSGYLVNVDIKNLTFISLENVYFDYFTISTCRLLLKRRK